MRQEPAEVSTVCDIERRQSSTSSPSALGNVQSLDRRPRTATTAGSSHEDAGVPFKNLLAASRIGRSSSMPTDNEFHEASFRLLSASKDVASVDENNSDSGTDTDAQHLVIFWTEALACFLALASLLAMIGTLYPYQGKPLPQWPFSIGINTLLSIYTVVLRAAISFLLSQGIALQKWQWFDKDKRPLYDYALFDEATRGPWGAAKLLWRLSLRHIGWWLGCLLVLMVLLVGPFTQQVLHYTDCIIADPDVAATVSRSNYFRGNGTHVGVDQNSITAAEQAAIDVGVQAVGQKVIPHCPSGNCTFAPYGTVGYCSSCVDVSNAVNFEVKNITISNLGGSYNSTGVLSSISQTYNYFSNDGPYANVSTFNTTQDGYQFLVGMPMDGPYDPHTGERPQGCDNAATNVTWRCRGFGAANCELYPCVRTYETSVIDGIVTEQLLDRVSLESAGFSFMNAYLLNTTCLTKAETGFLEKSGYSLESNQKWIFYNLTSFVLEQTPARATNDTVLMDFEKAVQQRGCVYVVNAIFPNSLPVYLTSSWNGALTGAKNYGAGMNSFDGPEILHALYNYGDFSFERTESLFENVTESLTSYMRNNPGVSISANAPSAPALAPRQQDPMNFTAPAKGTVYYNRTCLVVRWPWLTLSAVLVVMTLLFFALVLAEQQRVTHKVRSWMSSPLPLLAFGPNVHSFDTMTAPAKRQQDLETIEQAARHINAVLVTEPEGTMRVETSALRVMKDDQRS